MSGQPVMNGGDPFAADRHLSVADGPLRTLNNAGVLAAADLQIARRLVALGDEADPSVELATALAVRAARLGHALVDLAQTADVERAVLSADGHDGEPEFPWPEPEAWIAALAGSALVAVGEPGGDDDAPPPERPLRLVGSALYLDRNWRDERAVAAALHGLAADAPGDVDAGRLEDGLARLFGDDGESGQAAAARAAVERRLTVVAGGPGTGKTATVARIAALLAEQRAPERLLLALAAPTGKAAAQLQEAVREQAAVLPLDEPICAQLRAVDGSTLHRLLGWRPNGAVRLRHDRAHHLPHDVVIVDEASMLSLVLTRRLLEALRPDARLVLVGDPDQLPPIGVGTVLRDVIDANAFGAAAIVRLQRGFRYGDGIAAVADAVRDGDPDAVLAALEAADGEDVTWVRADPADLDDAGRLAPVRERAVAAGAALAAAARGGDAAGALAALSAFRILCAHRDGPAGVARWVREVESWLAADVGLSIVGAYVGRPLLITQNEYELQLFNGDAGVVILGEDGRATAVFDRGAGVLTVSPARLGAVETAWAMTVHKCQGAQLEAAAVLLPDPGSRMLSRELLYTAVTRARRALVLVASEASIRAAVASPQERGSALARRLTGSDDRWQRGVDLPISEPSES